MRQEKKGENYLYKNMKNYISIVNLSKVYANNFKALDEINLEIEKGEIFALLGPNGAGKSTFMKILAGELEQTDGEVQLQPGLKLGMLSKTSMLLKTIH